MSTKARTFKDALAKEEPVKAPKMVSIEELLLDEIEAEEAEDDGGEEEAASPEGDEAEEETEQ